jgi:UDP-N-acetylglucosamine--N-acetylmuramyl-(pentapeptide) pyrophosphoryl-undecaprenol N-acetylglucosamine transferase
MSTRILIMAGGTGGHVFPALAVADELTNRAIDVFWMGTEKGIEAKLVPAAGYPLSYIKVQGLRGNGLVGWLLAPFKVVKAIAEAFFAIRKIKPDMVLGLGGFASGPGGIAAKLAAIPLAIHEQNAIPGLTNKLLARVAQKVMQGFPNSFPSEYQAQWVGNPVRKMIEDLPAPALRYADRSGAMRILVLGGSLGAKSLNNVIPQALSLIDLADRPEVKHQCGQRHLEQCEQAYQQAAVDAEVVDFIDDMAAAYSWADLVICRAGALTIAEVAAAGCASLLIPYPYAVDDHQTHNASALVSVGAAQIIPETVLSAELLAEEIVRLANNRAFLLTMAIAARTQAKLGAAKVISDYCLELTHG